MVIVAIILISLLLSFFFSGMEIAYLSADKLQIHVDTKKNSVTGRIIEPIIKSPVRFLVTLLIGNTLALVVFGVFAARIVENFLALYNIHGFELLVIQTCITTAVILVVADFIPKNLFRVSPNFILQVFSVPCIIVYYVLMPVTSFVLVIANFILKNLMKVNILRYKNTFTKIDLESYLTRASLPAAGSEAVDSEVQIFRNALNFPDVRVRECMVSRLDIIGADIDEGYEKLKDKFQNTGVSRILIYKQNLDNVLGYVHFHEMFKNTTDIHKILIPVPVMPESMPAKDALRIFMQQHKSMGLVVDEFGVTSGVLTTEDVIEEIFGEIHDEHDEVEKLEKKLAPGEYLLSAQLEIDYLNSKYHFNLPSSPEYSTLGGLILFRTGLIPKPNDTLFIGEYQVKIVSATPTRIDQIHLKSQ